MSWFISEVQPDDHETLVACATAWAPDAGGVPPSVAIRSASELEQFLKRSPCLSVAAREDEQIIGFIVCMLRGGDGLLQRLMVSQRDDAAVIAKALMNRASRKLVASGRHKCRMTLDSDDPAFWAGLRWDAMTPMARGDEEQPKQAFRAATPNLRSALPASGEISQPMPADA